MPFPSKSNIDDILFQQSVNEKRVMGESRNDAILEAARYHDKEAWYVLMEDRKI